MEFCTSLWAILVGSGAFILNQMPKQQTGFGLVLKVTKPTTYGGHTVGF